MDYLADEAMDQERDIPNIRAIPLPNGNTMYAKRDEQFGFWHFNLDKGQIPQWLKGSYTSLFDAQKAIDKYMNELKEPAKAPALVSKKTDKVKTNRNDLFTPNPV